MNHRADSEVTPKKLEQDELTRILMHGMHEETMFYNRINFFMLIEALLFASLLEADGFKPENAGTAAICEVAGVLVTVIWLIVQYDKFQMFRAVSRRLESDVPDFVETLRILNEMYPRQVEATKLLMWFPPAVCGLAWLVLLAIATCRLGGLRLAG